MTYGDIYKAAYKLKVFKQFQLIEELMNEWGFLGRDFVKTRVKSWIATQIKYNTLLKVEEYFALTEFSNDIKLYIKTKKCSICGNEFVPQNSQEKYCSKACRSKAEYQQKKDKKKEYLKNRKDLNRKAVKKYKSKLQSQTQQKSPRKWEQWEIDLLIQMGRLTKTQMVEIAKKLNRSFKSVEGKYYQLRKEALV